MTNYSVIGLMSGTSLDGLDIAHCHFSFDGQWHYRIEEATTIAYPPALAEKLQHCMQLDATALAALDRELGVFFGDQTAQFIKQHAITPTLIASHGHTVFHQPAKGITVQIGNAEAIAKACKCMVISDFRSENVRLGGQGAPLVPIGDKLLFADFDFCLNLGGISNVSFDDEEGHRRAFDITPCNLVLNHYAQRRGLDYDTDGHIGASGTVHLPLLEALNNVNFYRRPQPKSLGKEDIVRDFLPLLEQYSLSMEDTLRTFYEHIGKHIGHVLTHGTTLVTGGGTYNRFLLSCIQRHAKSRLEPGNNTLTSFKEALIFGFLGVLRKRNEANVLKSYTGASQDTSSGVITLL